MSSILVIFQIIINFTENGLTLVLVNSKIPAKSEVPFQFPIALTVITIITSAEFFLMRSNLLETVLFPLLFFVYLLLTRSGKWTTKLFWSLLSTAFLAFTVLITQFIFITILHIDIRKLPISDNVASFQVIIFAKLLQAIIFYALSRKRFYLQSISTISLLLLCIIPLLSLFCMLLVFDITFGADSHVLHGAFMLAVSMSLLLINLAVFILYNTMMKQAHAVSEQEALVQQVTLQSQYYEEVNTLYENMRGWSHDYKNHLQALKGFVSLSQYEALENYLEEIDDVTSAMDYLIKTDNTLLDSIVNMKVSYAKSEEVDVDISINLPREIKISDTDLCSLLGNLLDNSLEACQRIYKGNAHRFIFLRIEEVRGDLGIRIRNSCENMLNLDGNRLLTTKKGRNHGIGLRQIDYIVKKYGGYLSREVEDSAFETVIRIPLDNVKLEPPV